MVDEVMLQDPDLELAKFQILDFSAPTSKDERVLTVMEASEIPRVSEQRKKDMLQIFAEGYFAARDELSEYKEKVDDTKDERPELESRQLDLYE